MFGAGAKRRATLLNCYVLPIKEDSIEGIFDWCKEAARTYSFGGGVGRRHKRTEAEGRACEQQRDTLDRRGIIHGHNERDDPHDRPVGKERRANDNA